MQDITSKMNDYNKLIAKYKMAEIFFNSKDVQDSEKLKFMDKLKQLTGQLEGHLNYFDKNKIKYSNEEGTEGFNVEFRVLRYEKYGY
jgi:hypothetical protein